MFPIFTPAPLPLPTPSPEPPVVSGVKGQIVDLERRYGSLAHRCSNFLQQQKVTAVELSTLLMSKMSVRSKEIHEKFLDDELVPVRRRTSFPVIWRKLTKYCNFLNYELLELMIHTYGPDSLKDDMETYATDLRLFRRKTRLCDFVEHWPKPTEPPKDAFQKLVVKLDKDWNTCTLEDLELLQQGLTQTFLSKEPVFFLGRLAVDAFSSLGTFPPSLPRH